MVVAYAYVQELKRNFDPELHKAASTSFSSLITELFKTNPQRGKQLLHVVGSFASCNDIGKPQAHRVYV